jgi:hypothetical protein
MQTEVLISADETGRLCFVYDDAVFDALKDLGPSTIARASHVEPTNDGRWTSDMGPVSGPVLGPFDTRQEALDAEHSWIEENVL